MVVMRGLLGAGFWLAEEERLLVLLLPVLEGAAVSGAAEALDRLGPVGLSFDLAVVNQAAVVWARGYALDLVRDLTETTRSLVQEALASFLETPGATMGDLVERLATLLEDERRARLIAVTETTQAYEQGVELGYQEAGLPPVAYSPPAHPGCYCSTAAEMLDSGEWVIVWRTNMDERVCTRALDTPWGTVAGCRDLEGVVVSAGPYLGRRVGEL